MSLSENHSKDQKGKCQILDPMALSTLKTHCQTGPFARQMKSKAKGILARKDFQVIFPQQISFDRRTSSNQRIKKKQGARGHTTNLMPRLAELVALSSISFFILKNRLDYMPELHCLLALTTLPLGTAQTLLYYMAGGDEQIVAKNLLAPYEIITKIQLPCHLFFKKCICPVFMNNRY